MYTPAVAFGDGGAFRLSASTLVIIIIINVIIKTIKRVKLTVVSLFDPTDVELFCVHFLFQFAFNRKQLVLPYFYVKRRPFLR